MDLDVDPRPPKEEMVVVVVRWKRPLRLDPLDLALLDVDLDLLDPLRLLLRPL